MKQIIATITMPYGERKVAAVVELIGLPPDIPLEEAVGILNQKSAARDIVFDVRERTPEGEWRKPEERWHT